MTISRRIRICTLSSVPGLLLFAASAFAADCEPGYQPFGDRCVSQRMADFITCVERSGGNKESIADEVRLSTPASEALRRPEEKALVAKVTRFFTGAMKACSELTADSGEGSIDTKQNLLEYPGLAIGMSLANFRTAFSRFNQLNDDSWRRLSDGNVQYSYIGTYGGVGVVINHYFEAGRLTNTVMKGSSFVETKTVDNERTDIDVSHDQTSTRSMAQSICGSSLTESKIWAAVKAKFGAPVVPSPIKEFDDSERVQKWTCPKFYNDSQCTVRSVTSQRKSTFVSKGKRAEVTEQYESSDKNYGAAAAERSHIRTIYMSRACRFTIAIAAE